MKNSKINKIINCKFLSLLSLTGVGLIFTTQTANAMFKNPKVQMPLVKSPDNKPLTLPKTYSGVSYVMNSDERKHLISSNGTSASLRNLGDGINSHVTTSNIGTGLRRAGDRFINNQ